MVDGTSSAPGVSGRTACPGRGPVAGGVGVDRHGDLVGAGIRGLERGRRGPGGAVRSPAVSVASRTLAPVRCTANGLRSSADDAQAGVPLIVRTATLAMIVPPLASGCTRAGPSTRRAAASASAVVGAEGTRPRRRPGTGNRLAEILAENGVSPAAAGGRRRRRYRDDDDADDVLARVLGRDVRRSAAARQPGRRRGPASGR